MKTVFFRVLLLTALFLFGTQHLVLSQDNINKEEVKKLLGESYAITKDYESAEKEYREILKNNPDNIKARIALADILSWQKKYDESIDEYKTALKADPDNIETKKKFAQVLSWNKNYDESITLYKEILSLKDDVELKKQLAEVYIWTKQFAQARELAESVLKENPGDTKAKLLLAMALQYSGESEKAIEYYKELLNEQK